MSWSPTLFSGSCPVGLPPVPWKNKHLKGKYVRLRTYQHPCSSPETVVRIICQTTRRRIPDGRNFHRHRVRTSNVASDAQCFTQSIELFLQNTYVHGTRLYGVTLNITAMDGSQLMCPYIPAEPRVMCFVQQSSLALWLRSELGYFIVRSVSWISSFWKQRCQVPFPPLFYVVVCLPIDFNGNVRRCQCPSITVLWRHWSVSCC
jgi:hypothetical protein